MSFRVGEQVGFLHEIGGGIIRRIDNQILYIEDETGFERPFRVNEVVRIFGTDYGMDSDDALHVLEDDSTEEHGHIVRRENRTGYLKPIDVWEIDLHIEELTATHSGMTNAQILSKQLSIFKSFYQKARAKQIRKLIVIHGVGEGVLKDEVRLFLHSKEGVEYYDASYQEYGKGATAVEIRYNI